MPKMSGCKLETRHSTPSGLDMGMKKMKKNGLTAKICPIDVSMPSPPKTAPVSGLPCRKRWRMQIARLCNAGWVPAARAEILVSPANTRGDDERWNATRECDAMSSRRDTRATPRSNLIERARCAEARLEGSSETDVNGTGIDGLKVEIRTGEVDQLQVELMYWQYAQGISRSVSSARTAPMKLM